MPRNLQMYNYSSGLLYQMVQNNTHNENTVPKLDSKECQLQPVEPAALIFSIAIEIASPWSTSTTLAGACFRCILAFKLQGSSDRSYIQLMQPQRIHMLCLIIPEIKQALILNNGYFLLVPKLIVYAQPCTFLNNKVVYNSTYRCIMIF